MKVYLRTLWIIFLVAVVVIVGGRVQLPAQGEAAKPVENHRYQIAAWGSGQFVEGRQRVSAGAYIVDSQTGDVYQIINNDAPTFLGSIHKKK
jgi:hypothetical protein